MSPEERFPQYDELEQAAGDFEALLDLVRLFAAVEVRVSQLSPLVHVDLVFHLLPARRLKTVRAVASTPAAALGAALNDAINLQTAEDCQT